MLWKYQVNAIFYLCLKRQLCCLHFDIKRLKFKYHCKEPIGDNICHGHLQKNMK